MVEIDSVERPALVAEHHVFAAPTLLAMHNGEEVARRTGVVSTGVVDDLCAAATSGRHLGSRPTTSGLIALRLVVAAVLVTSGVVGATPTLVAIGTAIAIWAVMSAFPGTNGLRTR